MTTDKKLPYFSLDEKDVYLYGYGRNTENIKRNLLKAGIAVKGIIDRRADAFGNPFIVPFEAMNKKYDIEKDVVVFVLGMQSAFTQEMVAGELFAWGYRQIIYAPIEHMNGNQFVLSYLRKCYLRIQNERSGYELYPVYELLHELETEIVIVECFKNRIEALVSIEYVRSFAGDDSYNAEIMRYRNKPFKAFSYLNELYDYFYQEGPFPEHYLKYYMNGTKDVSFLEDRRRLYDIFLTYWKESGLDFFIECPVSGRLSDEGMFNLEDGNHRASFLSCVGSPYIPMLISKSDLWQFYNFWGGGSKT